MQSIHQLITVAAADTSSALLDVSVDHKPTAATATTPSKWFVSPVIDLLFVCGLAPWLFGALAFSLFGKFAADANHDPMQRTLTLAFVIASVLIGEGHQFTSISRYLTAQPRRWKESKIDKTAMFAMKMFLALLLVLVLSTSANFDLQTWPFSREFVLRTLPVFLPGLFFFALALFPVALGHHIAAQARSLVLQYCALRSHKLSKSELRSLNVSMVCLVFASLGSIALPFGFTKIEPLALANTTQLSQGLALIGLGYFLVPVFLRYQRTRELMPIPALLLWTNLTLFLFLPLVAMAWVWIFVPLLFHATQHWAFAWHTQCKEDALAQRQSNGILSFVRLVVPVELLCLLILGSPIYFRLVTHTLVTPDAVLLPLEWSILVFYLHYFTDRIVWRPSQIPAKELTCATL